MDALLYVCKAFRSSKIKGYRVQQTLRFKRAQDVPVAVGMRDLHTHARLVAPFLTPRDAFHMGCVCSQCAKPACTSGNLWRHVSDLSMAQAQAEIRIMEMRGITWKPRMSEGDSDVLPLPPLIPGANTAALERTVTALSRRRTTSAAEIAVGLLSGINDVQIDTKTTTLRLIWAQGFSPESPVGGEIYAERLASPLTLTWMATSPDGKFSHTSSQTLTKVGGSVSMRVPFHAHDAETCVLGIACLPQA